MSKRITVPAIKVDIAYKCDNCDNEHTYFEYASAGPTLYDILAATIENMVAELGPVEIIVNMAKPEMIEVEVPDNADIVGAINPDDTKH